MQRREFARNALGLPVAAALSSMAQGAAIDLASLPPGGSITDVPGLKVGHYTLSERPTGCTVLICEAGATAGVDVRTVAGRLGHRNPSTTLNVYSHFVPETDQEAADALGRIFEDAANPNHD